MQTTSRIRNGQSLVSRLRESGINDTMIQIVQKERLTDDDIQSINRDDVDHLFKVENGFTFRDRKQFWQFVQKFQSSSTTMNIDNEVLCVELDVDSPEILEQIYEFGEEKPQSPGSIQRCTSSSSSNVNRQALVHLSDANNIYEFHDDDDHEEQAISSMSTLERVENQRELESPREYVFLYPTILPILSPKITKALYNDTISAHWTPFMREVADWVVSIKPSIGNRYEYQAICRSLCDKYPYLRKVGSPPWTLLSKRLSYHVRMAKRRQNTKKKIAETIAKKRTERIHNILSEIVL